MLEVNPETICFLIAKAHEFQAKEDVMLTEPPANAGEDWAMQVLEDHKSNPTIHEMKSTINDLEPDQQVAVVALMWLGRGDFDVEEWEKAIQQAGDSWNTRTAEYLIATPLLADYLQEGLSQLGYSCED